MGAIGLVDPIKVEDEDIELAGIESPPGMLNSAKACCGPTRFTSATAFSRSDWAWVELACGAARAGVAIAIAMTPANIRRDKIFIDLASSSDR
jgi:hypothetical protein